MTEPTNPLPRRLMFTVRCPECGIDVSTLPPCRICGHPYGCCPCVHEDDTCPTPPERTAPS